MFMTRDRGLFMNCSRVQSSLPISTWEKFLRQPQTLPIALESYSAQIFNFDETLGKTPHRVAMSGHPPFCSKSTPIDRVDMTDCESVIRATVASLWHTSPILFLF